MLPSPAIAATCSDYSNQAAAQRAADTRDADGDGIYCESLPCPCSTSAGGSGGGGGGGTTPKPKPKLGQPVFIHPRTKTTKCKVRGPLPDPACTPGAYYPGAVTKVICVSGYTSKVRHVTEATKRKVYAEYGITSHYSGQYEVDHLIPLELGGSNSIANLFPESASPTPGFHQKDKLENQAHAHACDTSGTLRHLQRSMATDWTKLYTALNGSAPR